MIETELNAIDNIRILKDEPLNLHTSFKIGGPAKYFIEVNDQLALIKVLEICLKHKEKYMMIGNGSNLLFSDRGYDGIIIKGGETFLETKITGDILYASSGVLLSKVAKVALEHSLKGFEFASGIPGTVGGAVLMNAGAYDGEIKDYCIRVRYIDLKALENNEDNVIRTIEAKDLAFDYRMSIFQKTGDIILGAEFKLEKTSDKEAIKEKMMDLNLRRKNKQPLEYPSAGSTFKRPKGNFAAKLIEECGLKGYSIGGAQVSEIHTGFIINKDKASSADVRALIEHCKKIVYNKTGFMLETEVRIID